MKKEFQKFKDVVTQQMSTIGGGGEVNLRKLDELGKKAKLRVQNHFTWETIGNTYLRLIKSLDN